MQDKQLNIYVAGHNGLVGSAIVRQIESAGVHTWVGASRKQLDLCDRNSVFDFMGEHEPDGVIIAAAKVGGIAANNSKPVAFLRDNLQIQSNLMSAAFFAEVEKFIFLCRTN